MTGWYGSFNVKGKAPKDPAVGHHLDIGHSLLRAVDAEWQFFIPRPDGPVQSAQQMLSFPASLPSPLKLHPIALPLSVGYPISFPKSRSAFSFPL